MTISAINFELSGGQFNVRRRVLATFTMTEADGKIIVSDDRPSHCNVYYRDTTFATVSEAVRYWGAIDERRMIMG